MLSTHRKAPVFIAAAAMFVFALALNFGCGRSGGSLDVYSVVESPSFSPSAGTYSSAETVTLSSKTPAATIYYTMDDSEPKETSTKYAGPITVSATVRIKAKAYLAPKVPSAITSAIYTINGRVAVPTFSPEADTYPSAQSVSISCLTSGAKITYTTDDTTPTEASTIYTGPITIADTTTVKARAFREDWGASEIASGTYYIGQESPPSLTSGGTFEGVTSKSIEITGSPGSKIYCTTDGSEPSDTSYNKTGSSPLTVDIKLDSSSPVKTQTIKAISAISGKANSPVASETYTISLTTEAVVVDSDGIDGIGIDGIGKYTSIAIDPSGRPNISYFDQANQSIKHAYLSAGIWVKSTVDTGVGAGGGYTSIAINRETGKMHISYYDSVNRVLRYATDEGASWNKQTVDSGGDVGAYTSIALDSKGFPHISYYDRTNKKVKYSGFKGGSWETSEISSTAVGDDIYGASSIAVDSGDCVYVLFHDGSGNISCKTTSPLGSAYTATLAVSGGQPGVGLFLERTSDRAYSVYNTGDLKYSYSKDLGRNWNTETIDSSSGLENFSIAWHYASDSPHVSSYSNTLGSQYLKYFTKDGFSWKEYTVDNSGVVGRYSSIAVDGSGYFHISYYDEANGNLKYATNKP